MSFFSESWVCLLMGLKEKALVVGFTGIVCLVVSTVHTAPFGVGPARDIPKNRPGSKPEEEKQKPSSSPGSVWKNIERRK